jgi:hypothetical protein
MGLSVSQRQRLRYEPNRLMLPKGLWRWYINITITILDIVHRPVFYLNDDILEIGFFLRFQMESTQLDPIHRGSLCLSTPYAIFANLEIWVIDVRKEACAEVVALDIGESNPNTLSVSTWVALL